MREHSQLRSQYRVVRPDGSVCHIASLAAVATDSIDASPRLVGIDLDITERVEADERERKPAAAITRCFEAGGNG